MSHKDMFGNPIKIGDLVIHTCYGQLGVAKFTEIAGTKITIVQQWGTSSSVHNEFVNFAPNHYCPSFIVYAKAVWLLDENVLSTFIARQQDALDSFKLKYKT